MVEKEAGEDGGGATATAAASSSSSSMSFGLPDELLEVLPSDPFQQLDVARKITSIVLSTRVSSLEAQLTDRDDLISDLRSQIESLDASLSAAADKLYLADQDKDNLSRENASLSNTVRKLQRDVARLEVFRKTLMQSLQEEEDSTVKSTVSRGFSINCTSLTSSARIFSKVNVREGFRV